MERADQSVYDQWHEYARHVVQTNHLHDFRTHPHLQYMLEHPHMFRRCKYWFEKIEQLRISLGISRRCVGQAIAANEILGKSDKNSRISELPPCNAVSLRYAYHALCVLKHWSTLSYATQNVVEIGGGYGGFAVVFLTLLKVTGRALPLSYTLVDLPCVSDLQQAYVTALLGDIPTKLNFVHFGEFSSVPEHYLFSAYSFSEIPCSARDYYASTVLPKTQAGLLVWNSVSDPEHDINKHSKFILTREPEHVFETPHHYHLFFTLAV